jgi:hypothetical protein
MALNITKINIVSFALKQSYNSLVVASGNLSINEVPVIKLLGLQIDKNLNWKSHVEYILPKLSSASFVSVIVSYFMSNKIV